MSNRRSFIHKFLLFFFFISFCSIITVAQSRDDIIHLAQFEDSSLEKTIKLPIWNTEITFPGEAYYEEANIYTSKGIGIQKFYKWSDSIQNVRLSVSYYTNSESINSKNEKSIFNSVANKLAVKFDGIPLLGVVVNNQHNIKECRLRIETLKGEFYEAKIYAKSNMIMIADAIVSEKSTKSDIVVEDFFRSVKFNSFSKNPIQQNVSTDKTPIWDTLFVEDFFTLFPKHPVDNHHQIKSIYGEEKYYEWYMRDKNNLNTYVFSIIPLSNFNISDKKSIVQKNILQSLKLTKGKLVQDRDLDYFDMSAKEVVFKTQEQYFRVRIFYDEKNIYQLLVSGSKQLIFNKNANRFLDGLKWTE